MSASTKLRGLVSVRGIYIRFANSIMVADLALGNTISSNGLPMIAIDFCLFGVLQEIWKWAPDIEICA